MLGAIYLDGGFTEVQKAVRKLFSEHWPAQSGKTKGKDGKSRLQEVTQQFFKERPVYVLVSSAGPEHDKLFTVRLELPDKTVFVAAGSSVKRAEQTAAHMALKFFEENRQE